MQNIGSIATAFMILTAFLESALPQLQNLQIDPFVVSNFNFDHT